MKQTINLLKIILVITIICISIPRNLYATSGTTSGMQEGTVGNVIEKGNDWLNGATPRIGSGIKDVVAQAFGILISIGAIVAFIITGIQGVKFILASAEGKAEIKESMTPYIIGCIVTFGAYAIWKVAISILNF